MNEDNVFWIWEEPVIGMHCKGSHLIEICWRVVIVKRNLKLSSYMFVCAYVYIFVRQIYWFQLRIRKHDSAQEFKRRAEKQRGWLTIKIRSIVILFRTKIVDIIPIWMQSLNVSKCKDFVRLGKARIIRGGRRRGRWKGKKTEFFFFFFFSCFFVERKN